MNVKYCNILWVKWYSELGTEPWRFLPSQGNWTHQRLSWVLKEAQNVGPRARKWHPRHRNSLLLAAIDTLVPISHNSPKSHRGPALCEGLEMTEHLHVMSSMASLPTRSYFLSITEKQINKTVIWAVIQYDFLGSYLITCFYSTEPWHEKLSGFCEQRN